MHEHTKIITKYNAANYVQRQKNNIKTLVHNSMNRTYGEDTFKRTHKDYISWKPTRRKIFY